MADFTIIDLVSQHEAVRNHTRGMTVDAVLAWLRSQGIVTELSMSGGQVAYHFESHTRLQANFCFQAGELVIIGAHGPLP